METTPGGSSGDRGGATGRPTGAPRGEGDPLQLPEHDAGTVQDPARASTGLIYSYILLYTIVILYIYNANIY